MSTGIETIRTNDSIVITIPTKDMDADYAENLIALIKMEFVVRRSRMTEEDAREIAEDIKASWWSENKQRINAMMAEHD